MSDEAMPFVFCIKKICIFERFFKIMFLKHLILFVLVFNLFILKALGNIPDSLENRLKRAKSDTAKVMVYNRFARDLMTGQNRNYYQVREYAQQGGRNHIFYQALEYAQDGLALAEQIQFYKGRAELHRTIGNAYVYLIDNEKAIEHYEQALNICEKIQDMNCMALNYYNIALVYNRQHTKVYYTLEILLKALSIWKQLDKTDYIYRAYQSIITVYRNVREFQLAETYAKEAISLAIETGNRQEEALLYSIYAQNSILNDNVQAAEEYYQKSLRIYEELDDQLRIANTTLYIASDLRSDCPETAIDLFRKSAAILEKRSPNNLQLFNVYNGLADMFWALNNDDSTRYYKEKALSKAIITGNAQTIANAYHIIGRYYMDIGNLTRAKSDFQNAYDIALKSGLYDLQSKVLSELSSIDYLKGNYKTAFENLREYLVINDSLSREENKSNVQQLTMQYEFKKDLKENSEVVKSQFERQQQAIKHQRTVVVIVSIALICAAILMVFLVRSNRRNRQTNKKLEQQHREIISINDELTASHNELSRYKDNLEEMVKEQTAKLQQSEIQLRTLSDNLPGGCIYQRHVFQDGKEIISYVSSTAEKWLGISADAIMDDINAYYRQMLPEDIEKKRELEQNSLHTMSSNSFEYRLKKGNQEIWLLENTIPRTEQNRTIVWDGIIVDITDRKKFEKDLIDAKERAEESDRLKSAFLANMSHEIRTPMNGIVGFLGFIEREDLPAEKRHTYIDVIRSNVQQLLQLIGDIVDISKMDSHQLSLHHISFDLNSLLDELEIFFLNFIMKRDKKMELFLDRSQFISPCIIESDPVRLRQILSNLIGNAVKFTDMGFIRFGYELKEDSNQLYFFVEDTGIGIPESKQEYIFKRFRQLHDEKSEKNLYGGTGLGLAISKNLVEMMGGEIGVESVEGVGSTFYFTLPYR